MALDFPNPPLTIGQQYAAATGVLYVWDGTVWTAGAATTGLPPTGPAGGDLTGNYPTPDLGPGVVGNAELANGAVSDAKVTDVAWGKITGAPTIPAPQVLAYRHVQASAATVWTIPHNLTFRPNVTAVDSTGRAIWPGALDYTSATTVTLTFSAAVGGEAYCT